MKQITNGDRKRLVTILFFLLFLFTLLVNQFYKIQIAEGDKWTKLGARQHYFIVHDAFQRGRIFSNTSIKKNHSEQEQPLVVDILKFHLHADPDSIPSQHYEEIANRLGELIDLTKEENSKLKDQLHIKSRNRKLVSWLDKQSRDHILDWWYPFSKKHKIPKNALFFVNDYQRSYPFGKLLGQVLHTVQNQKDELTKQAIPTGGLELCFDHYLKGKMGKRRLMRSPRNAFETGDVIATPQNGADIYITVNHCLQAICEEELEKGVKNVQAKGGWVVMMDPFSGEILALAQYPSFYPPDYQMYFNDKEMIEHTKVKALTDTTEPGSIFKPISLCIALKANEVLKSLKKPVLFDPNVMVPTTDSYFKGRGKPLVDTTLHKFLNMRLAIQKSSNIYPARLLEKISAHSELGPQFIRNNLIDTFGLGVKTHIELPAESSGVVPTPGKKHANGKEEWSISTPVSIAFGHNLQVTSIQMLRAFSVLVNGGYLVQPTIIRKIVNTQEDGQKKVLMDNTQEERIKQFPHVLPKEYCDEMVKCLKYCTKFGGTARRADVPGFTEAGKTSTAKKIVDGRYSETVYCPSFVGFTPANKPAFIMVVTIDEPKYGFVPGEGKLHHGGTCCAPVFKEIAKRSLAYLGVAPDDPFGYPVNDPRRDPDKADFAKELKELKELYEKWNTPKVKL